MTRILSIIVPIKGSYEYIKSIIEQTNLNNTNKLELVIQDNTNENIEILDYLNQAGNHNINYFHNPEPLTMTENFELGIKNSKGEYVCILGADDIFSSKILDVVEYMVSNNIDSAIFNKAIFYWPGMKYRAHHERPNLTIYRSNGSISSIDVSSELEALLKKGMVSLGKLPSPYQGIVKKVCLEKVYTRTGKYIPGACPDMAMAVALSEVVKKHVFINAPFTISGQSYNSAGGKGARGEHRGDLKNKSFLPRNIEETWPSFVPKIWTGSTIYADSMYSCLKAMGCLEKLNKFNKEANYANIIAFFPDYLKLVAPFLDTNIRQIIKVIIHSILIFYKRSVKYIKNWANSKLRITTNTTFYNITTSLEAAKLVDKYLENRIKIAPFFSDIDINR